MNAFIHELLGRGMYKLGYVTADRDAAILALQKAYPGLEFVTFEPTTKVNYNGTGVAAANLRCAFGKSGPHVIEVMEPVDGAVGLWSGRVPASGGAAVAFHHIGVVVDDMDSVLAAAAAVGLTPLQVSEVPGALRVSYFDLPVLDHFVECVEYLSEGQGYLEQARGTGDTE